MKGSQWGYSSERISTAKDPLPASDSLQQKNLYQLSERLSAEHSRGQCLEPAEDLDDE